MTTGEILAYAIAALALFGGLAANRVWVIPEKYATKKEVKDLAKLLTDSLANHQANCPGPHWLEAAIGNLRDTTTKIGNTVARIEGGLAAKGILKPHDEA